MGGDIFKIIGDLGMPVAAALAGGYFVYLTIKLLQGVLGSINGMKGIIIALDNRIRMLDNDLIRLNQKVNTVLHLRGKTIEFERVEAEAEINKQTLKKADDEKLTAEVEKNNS